MAPHNAGPRSLRFRRLDLLYITWFIIHFSITILIDCVPLYPHALQFQALLDVRADYALTYRDPLAINPPAWFDFYIWLEGLYQAPLCIYAIGALWNDHPVAPVHLLVYAVQTAVTTSTCLVHIFSSDQITQAEKLSLTWLYAGFAIVPGLLGLDMFMRIRRKLLLADTSERKMGKTE